MSRQEREILERAVLAVSEQRAADRLHECTRKVRAEHPEPVRMASLLARAAEGIASSPHPACGCGPRPTESRSLGPHPNTFSSVKATRAAARRRGQHEREDDHCADGESDHKGLPPTPAASSFGRFHMHLRSPRDAPIDSIASPILVNPESAPELPIELVMYITKPREGPGRTRVTVCRICDGFGPVGRDGKARQGVAGTAALSIAGRRGREPRRGPQRRVPVACRDPLRCHAAMLGSTVQ